MKRPYPPPISDLFRLALNLGLPPSYWPTRYSCHDLLLDWGRYLCREGTVPATTAGSQPHGMMRTPCRGEAENS